MIESLIDSMSALIQTDQLALLWSIAGISMIILEMLLPGFFLLWLGFSALLTAIIAYFFPLPILVTFIIFSLCSLVLVMLTRHMYKHLFQLTSKTSLNRRGMDLIGKSYTLEEPIHNGKGRLRIGDSFWMIQGDDAPLGQDVIVTAIEGNHLIVKRK